VFYDQQPTQNHKEHFGLIKNKKVFWIRRLRERKQMTYCLCIVAFSRKTSFKSNLKLT